MSGGKPLYWSEVPVVCQTHPLAGPNVTCDTSHPITRSYRWPAAYVCGVHDWIPNQTLSGAITVWAPNLLWSLALSHSPTIHLMLQPHISRSAMPSCKHVLCPKDAFIPGAPAHPPQGWRPEITPSLCFLRPVDHFLSLARLNTEKDCCWYLLYKRNQILYHQLSFSVEIESQRQWGIL